MIVINEKAIEDFIKSHARAKSSLNKWLTGVKAATWKTSIEVVDNYPKAECVNGLWIFNIAGNNYRLTAYIRFPKQELIIVKVMTHAEYDKEKY
jgi:mRNA interferase HigB